MIHLLFNSKKSSKIKVQTRYGMLFTLMLFSILLSCKRVESLQLPSNFPRCYQPEYYSNEYEHSKCIEKAGNNAREILKRGIPKLGIPAIDGLIIPKIVIEQKTRSYQFIIALSNLTVEGLDTYIFRNVSFTKLNRVYKAEAILPKVDLRGTYEIWGNIFNQNINQTGPVTATVYNASMGIHVEINLYKRRGVTFMNLTKVDVNVDVGSAVGKFDNLFGEAETLNKAVNAFLEQSTTDIVRIALPDFKKVLSDLFVGIIGPLTRVVPYDNILLKKD